MSQTGFPSETKVFPYAQIAQSFGTMKCDKSIHAAVGQLIDQQAFLAKTKTAIFLPRSSATIEYCVFKSDEAYARGHCRLSGLKECWQHQLGDNHYL